MKSVKLSQTDDVMPTLGLGTWQVRLSSRDTFISSICAYYFSFIVVSFRHLQMLLKPLFIKPLIWDIDISTLLSTIITRKL